MDVCPFRLVVDLMMVDSSISSSSNRGRLCRLCWLFRAWLFRAELELLDANPAPKLPDPPTRLVPLSIAGAEWNVEDDDLFGMFTALEEGGAWPELDDIACLSESKQCL